MELKNYLAFKISKEQAIANYKKDVKFKLLSPFVFRKFKNLYKMQAIYLPFLDMIYQLMEKFLLMVVM